MSAITDSQPTAARHANLRALLAGGTATIALIAGAVIVFVALAAYVAFDGLPGGGDEEQGADTVFVGEPTAGAPEAAAAALGAAPAAVAAAPAAPTAVAPPPGAAPTGPATSTAPSPVASPGGNGGNGSSAVTTPSTPSSQGEGALGGPVSDLEDTTDSLGLDVPLQEVTDPITGPLDQNVNDALNNVGGLLGNPNLGNQVTQGLNNIGGKLLGPGGLTDQLLGQ